MRRLGMLGLFSSAALTLGGLASHFGAMTIVAPREQHLVSIAGGKNRYSSRRRFGPTRVKNYRSTDRCATERERRAAVRKIYMDGEKWRKAMWKPDDRDDKYLHSHARRARALKRALAA